jgi:PAS domain S-box-containing protein
LVVNDVPDLVELMKELLHQSGYNVLTAYDGQEGFVLTRAEHPNLVISDVSMPRLDGIEMCRLIRAHPELRTIPVLLVSAKRRDSASVIEGLKAGADDYLESPYDPMRLITRVAQLIERRRAEEALRESQVRLAGIVESAMDAIITVDGEQRILLFNRAAEMMFRCPAAEAIGQRLQRFIPERFRTIYSAHIEGFGQVGITTRSMAGSSSVNGLRADGEEFPVEASISQVEANRQKLYTVIMRDITERKRAEEVRERLATIVESSQDAILSKNLDGTITSWNAGAEKMYGYTEAEVVGRHISLIVPPERQEELAEIMAKLRGGEQIKQMETVRVRRDGSLIDISITTSPIKDDRGRIVGASTIARDITERKRAEEEVRRLNETLEQRVQGRTVELEAANRELESFSYSVSHDLRAPLRALDGFSQAILEDYADRLDNAGQDYLRRVRGAAERMGHLIDEMLKLFRVTRGELRRTAVDMSTLARLVIAELGKAEPRRAPQIEIMEGLWAEGDAPLLRVVLENLLGNAWKFTSKRQGAQIEFGGEQREDGQMVFYVRDNGAGFDMAYAGMLFGAFHRLHTDAEFEGTGIGLATVQRIVRRHGGRAWAQGEVGAGATIFFTLQASGASIGREQ